MRLLLRLSLLWLGYPPAAALAEAREDPMAQLAQSEAAAAIRLAQSPRGAVHLMRLHALKDEIVDLDVLAHTYLEILRGRRSDSMVRAIARALAADVERARGRLEEAAELIDPLGYINDFYVLGSFDNEGKAGCDIDFGPETRLDLRTSYPAKGHAAEWRNLTVASPNGYVDLAASLRPNREAVGYALTLLKSPSEARAVLAVGASGAFRLWVNGQLAASEDRYNDARPDQSRVSVQLRKGVNRVLLKVCQEGGPFGFYLRVEARTRVKAILPDALPPLEKGPGPAPKVLPTIAVRLEHEVQKHPGAPELRGEYATALAFSRAYDESRHTDLVEAERAADAAPSDVLLQLLAAKLQEEDADRRRERLEAAVRADPKSSTARLQLAQHHLARGHPDRALPEVETLVRENPQFVAARVALIHAHGALGEWPRAAALTEQALQDFPHHPVVAREAAREARRMERVQEAVAHFRAALALRYDDVNSRRSLSVLLADIGHVEEAAEEMRLMLKLDPFDNFTRMRLAELCAANGAADTARQLFDQAKALAPDEPEVHEREGRAFLQLGKRKEALSAFERSLQLRPQNPALREAWRLLSGENGTVGLEHAFEVSGLVREADAMVDEDAVYLADYTYVRVQPSGLSSRFRQVGVKVYTQRGVDAFRSFPITYAPDRQEVRILQARITKPDGLVLDSYSESERSLNEPWSGIYYDARAKVLSFPVLSVGDVLEIRYRLDDSTPDNLLSDYWGDVDYVQTVRPKVRYQYIADMPPGRTLYWNKSSLPPEIGESEHPQSDGRTLYRWTACHLSKIVPEPSMPGWAEVVPTLHLSTYKTWDDVARYYWGLIRDQLIPNGDIRKAVDQALTGVNRKDELAIIRAIYNFVVTNTRYVALEFGIHGFKPYRVDRVLARRFGDCKDKASLIHSMLEIAGIDSDVVLVRMRHLGSISPEPASLAVFNHAITYIPKFNLFLDGTAEFHGSRELPSADRLANILIVDPNGNSAFGTIPEAKAEQNVTRISLDVALQEDGSAAVIGQSTVAGQSAPEYRRSYQTGATRKAIFEQGWAQAFPGLTVQQVNVNDPGKLDEDVTLSYRMSIPRYAEALPKSLRFHPFGSGRSYTETYAPLSERRFDLLISNPWLNRYEFQYVLPVGFDIPELPPDLNEESPFGRLLMSHRIENGRLICRAEVALTQTRIKASEYRAFREFMGRLDRAFSRRLLASATRGQTAQE